MGEPLTKRPDHGGWADDLFAGLAGYYLTSLALAMGLLLGADFLHTRGTGRPVPHGDLLTATIHFDAHHYLDIIDNGYAYDSTRASTVAFFPAYPALAWCVAQTGLSSEVAALVTANIALLAAFVLLAGYVRARWPDATPWQRAFVLAIFGLWPMSLFWRMPYAESLFLAGTLLFLYGMARGWPLPVLAVLAGFPTAVRPVGVAVTAAFLWYVVARPGLRPGGKVARLLVLGPLACWGLLAWMGYQWLAFDAPLGFAQTQDHWTFQAPQDRTWPAKAWSLATLRPLWGAYVPGYPGGWYFEHMPGGRVFSLYFWNPILFVLAAILVVLGWWKRWLTGSELVLGLGLLAIPYVTRSYEMSMASHGRFAAVVVVNYLVLGRIFARASPMTISAVCAGLAVSLCVFTALYGADYPVF